MRDEMDQILDEATALLALAERGVPPDIQEMLVHGDASRGIAPRALRSAINEVMRHTTTLKAGERKDG